jgi:hypothetical protein
LLITLYYSNINLKTVESFGTVGINEAADIGSKYFVNNGTSQIVQSPSNATPNINLDDTSSKTMIDGYITDLSKTLDKYTTLDVPIIINNNRKICDSWGDYNNSKYKANTNQCLIVKGQRSCLTKSNLVSCSNYYDDGKINALNNIDTDKILNSVKDKILIDYDNVNQTIIEKNTNIYGILNDLIDKRNLENQQLYFIEYNDSNLNDKKKLIDNSKDEFEKVENDLNINKMNFSIFLEQNNNNDNISNVYYKIITGLIFFIIVIGVLNFLFSELF